MARHIGEAMIGAIFCAAVYLALAKTPLPAMLIAYALHVVVGGFNIVLFVFVVIMIALAHQIPPAGLRGGAVPVCGDLVFGGRHPAREDRCRGRPETR
jgi:hypothetical protein